PQMLLQPIVENAIFHGIVPTDREGIIKISGRKMDDGVEIVIHDNGRGMEKERLSQVQQAAFTPNTSVGIGLLHVFESVNLYFESDSTVKVESSTSGTIVELIVKPKKLR
ncbi:sensor histidine kinase, partial [Bacillus solitudinis]